jgi:hypothetical protein
VDITSDTTTTGTPAESVRPHAARNGQVSDQHSRS